VQLNSYIVVHKCGKLLAYYFLLAHLDIIKFDTTFCVYIRQIIIIRLVD